MPLWAFGATVVLVVVELCEPEDEELPHPAANAIVAVSMTNKGRGRIARRYQRVPVPQSRALRPRLNRRPGSL